MRLIIGRMFACHGGQKLLGFPGVGGRMIAFGFLTPLAAFISAGEMAVAYFMVHAAAKRSVMRQARPSNFFQF
jgi:putative oxidoreductase